MNEFHVRNCSLVSNPINIRRNPEWHICFEFNVHRQDYLLARTRRVAWDALKPSFNRKRSRAIKDFV